MLNKYSIRYLLENDELVPFKNWQIEDIKYFIRKNGVNAMDDIWGCTLYNQNKIYRFGPFDDYCYLEPDQLNYYEKHISWSLLMYITSCASYEESFHILLKAGADPYLRDVTGRNVFDILNERESYILFKDETEYDERKRKTLKIFEYYDVKSWFKHNTSKTYDITFLFIC